MSLLRTGGDRFHAVSGPGGGAGCSRPSTSRKEPRQGRRHDSKECPAKLETVTQLLVIYFRVLPRRRLVMPLSNDNTSVERNCKAAAGNLLPTTVEGLSLSLIRTDE
jgi:hypothetical protein